MGNFFNAVKAGFAAFREGTQPREYTIAGRPIRCPHCGERTFIPGSALLNTAGATLVNLDWLNPSATILICSECSRIEWFAQEPEGGR